MKRLIAVVLLMLLLTGCSGDGEELDRAMALRSKLQASSGCSFEAVISADYGDKSYSFSVTCQADEQGNVTFQVTQPESIAGISGRISEEGGKLTFDDTALAFELLADGQVTPVSAPWLLVKTLRSGYVTSCGSDEDGIRASIDDSYEEDALHVDIWLDAQDIPDRAEIIYDDRRYLPMDIENFRIL